MRRLSLLLIITILTSCHTVAQDQKNNKKFDIIKTDAQWKATLTDMQYYVLRKAGTERPFTSDLLNIKTEGTFVCAACKNPLYKTKHKYNSGTGWPSFDRAIEGSIALSTDNKLGYTRDELLCGRCGGHLGHIFNDGPRQTTGKRHCINGVALEFIPKNKADE